MAQFSSQNLQGQSFKGQDLRDADFSNSDIRGADFTNAILIRANFSQAKAGLQRSWTIGLVISSLVLSALSGLTAALAGTFLGYSFLPRFVEQYSAGPGIVVLVLFSVFFVISIRQDLEAALGGMAAAIVAAGVIVIVASGAGTGIFIPALIIAFVAAVIVAGAGMVAGMVAGGFAVAITVVFAVAIAGVITVILAVTGVGVVGVEPAKKAMASAVALAGSVAGAGAFAMASVVTGAIAFAVVVTLIVHGINDLGSEKTPPSGGRSRQQRSGTLVWAKAVTEAAVGIFAVAFAIGLAGAVAGVLAAFTAGSVAFLGVYIGWQAISRKERYALIRRIMVALIAIGGTSFRRANLTEANFIQASLSSTDFRRATLNRVRWPEAEKLEARFGERIPKP